MARKIIILDKDPNANAFNFACWLDVPLTRQGFYANANLTSRVGVVGVDNTVPGVILQAELDALRSGAVIEVVERVEFAQGTPVGQILSQLIQTFTQRQAEITGRNLWGRYGSSWDGTTWTAAGVS